MTAQLGFSEEANHFYQSSNPIVIFYDPKSLQMLETRPTLLQLIEHSREKMPRRANPQIYEESPSSNSHSASRQKKKIKKQHQKKKSRAVSQPPHDQPSPIQQLLKANPSLLTPQPSQIITDYRQALTSTSHVRQLLFESEKTLDVKQADCQQETGKYFALLRTARISDYQRIGIANRTEALAIGLLRKEADLSLPGNPRTTRFLSPVEELLLQRREVVREQVREYVERTAAQMGYSQIQINDIDLEILTLAKIGKQVQQQIIHNITQAIGRQECAYNCQLDGTSSKLQNQYMSALIIKNLERACGERPIDFLNYHKRIEAYENNGFMEDEYRPIEDLAALKKYLEQKKPKHNKNEKTMLRTPCAACLSDYGELSNPIVKCAECTIRVHKHCQDVGNRCHRCRFCRTAKEEKNKTGFCYICHRKCQKGLNILTVTNRSPHYFAHNFCLLVHQLWSVEEEKFKGHYEPKQVGANKGHCSLCNERGGITLTCDHCGQQLHAMCAYLSGSSLHLIRIPEQPKGYKIIINCGGQTEERRRLSLQRKFKLNFEKIIFKQDKNDTQNNWEEITRYVQEAAGQ